MKKAIVTGGAGFIGSHIVEKFQEGGYEVQVIDDLSSGQKENLRDGVKLHEIDIRSDAAAKVLQDEAPDVLVHCAAQMSVRVSMEKPVFDTEVNVVGVVNLLHAFRGRKYPFFVFLSTGGAIYGEQETFPASEDHPVAANSVYGTAKRVGEMYLDLWAREMGLDYAALRLGNVYGPRQNPHGEAGVVAIFNKILLEGGTPKIFGSGEQTRDFVFVKDVVRAVWEVAERRQKGIFNIGTAKETSVNKLFQFVCSSLGKDQEAEYHPAKEGEQMRSCIDPSHAGEVFGWSPSVTVEDGLKITSDWFREQVGKA